MTDFKNFSLRKNMKNEEEEKIRVVNNLLKYINIIYNKLILLSIDLYKKEDGMGKYKYNLYKNTILPSCEN